MSRPVVLLACLTTVLAACNKEAAPPALPTPAAPPAAQTPPPTPAPTPAPAAAPAPTAPLTPSASTSASAGTAPAADALDTFRSDTSGKKTISDIQIIQTAVDGYNTTRNSLPEPDSKPGPELNDLSDLVKYRRLPRLPAPPAGKKFSLDKKTQKVILVNE